ncbi:MAG: hypothetical protein EPN24_06520 [Candidatus Methanoperedens sp.]|nr:MAG: hypothetical protein EPN24_06520 [Candidatus Methanoperedens sp.]
MIAEKFKPLWSDVKILNSSSQYTLNEGDVRGLTREQIELRVFSDRIKLDGRYRDNVDEIVKTMIEVKKMAAAGIGESDIEKEVRWCFEKIRTSRMEDA